MFARLTLLVGLLVSAHARAEVDEDWSTLPTDAGVEQRAEPHEPPRSEAYWNPFTLSAGVLAATGSAVFFGGEGAFGATFGKGRPVAHDTFVEGWFVTPLVELAYGGWGSRPVCTDASLCASRFTAGAGMRAGWGRGVVTRSTGRAPVGTALFGQLSVSGAALSIPSAPLVPASAWAELVIRARLGVLASATPTPSLPSKGTLIVHLALTLEAVPASRFSRGAAVGLSVGATY